MDGLHLFRRYLSFARRTCIIFTRKTQSQRERERKEKVEVAVEKQRKWGKTLIKREKVEKWPPST